MNADVKYVTLVPMYAFPVEKAGLLQIVQSGLELATIYVSHVMAQT